MYFRKRSPRTRCLYSADSTLPRMRSAASKSSFAKGRSPFAVPLRVAFATMSFRRLGLGLRPRGPFLPCPILTSARDAVEHGFWAPFGRTSNRSHLCHSTVTELSQPRGIVDVDEVRAARLYAIRTSFRVPKRAPKGPLYVERSSGSTVGAAPRGAHSPANLRKGVNGTPPPPPPRASPSASGRLRARALPRGSWRAARRRLACARADRARRRLVRRGRGRRVRNGPDSSAPDAHAARCLGHGLPAAATRRIRPGSARSGSRRSCRVASPRFLRPAVPRFRIAGGGLFAGAARLRV